MIIVSKPPTEATRVTNTDRDVAAAHPAHNDTPGYADVQLISVHTKRSVSGSPSPAWRSFTSRRRSKWRFASLRDDLRPPLTPAPRRDGRPGRGVGRGVGGASCWGPFGDHTSCTEANNPHVNHSPARRLDPR